MKNNMKDFPVIFIDQKRARIRIHRNTLRLLGNPAFVQLLVNPEKLTIAICPAIKADAFTHRILWKNSEKNSHMNYIATI